MQINFLHRCKANFDIQEREIIYNTFILANVTFCPIIWHVCGNICTKKIF